MKLTSSSPPLRGGQSANSVFPIKRLIRTDMVGLPVHIPIPPSPVSNSSTGQRVYVKPSSSTVSPINFKFDWLRYKVPLIIFLVKFVCFDVDQL